jgi:phospholipid/cholesterol/gamma-HCH transport system ATP-binding protein
MSAMIEVRALSIGYSGIPLLRGLTFDVADGDVFVILGGSGCGKSTLLRHLIGLEPPIEGAIHFACGKPELAGAAPTFGVLFQSGALFGSMTLAQNVALPLQKWTRLDAVAIDTIVRAKLRLVGLEGYENHLPAEISGGMKKRAGIARAMALDAPLLFLDEPSAGLDPVTSAELDALILALNASLGVTVVIVSHELASIFAIGQHCIMLDKTAGGIIARGNPVELRDHSDDPRVAAFFKRRPIAA